MKTIKCDYEAPYVEFVEVVTTSVMAESPTVVGEDGVDGGEW